MLHANSPCSTQTTASPYTVCDTLADVLPAEIEAAFKHPQAHPPTRDLSHNPLNSADILHV